MFSKDSEYNNIHTFLSLDNAMIEPPPPLTPPPFYHKADKENGTLSQYCITAEPPSMTLAQLCSNTWSIPVYAGVGVRDNSPDDSVKRSDVTR